MSGSGGWPNGSKPTGRNAFEPSSTASAYAEALAFLKGRQSRRLSGKATKLLAGADSISIEYHETDVVTYHADGRVELDCGGWHTQTTKYKMQAYCPGLMVWLDDSILRVARSTYEPDALVEEAKLAVIEEAKRRGGDAERDARILLTGEQPSLPFKRGENIILHTNGLLAYSDESRAEAVARVEAWRNRPPEPARKRFTPRNPNPAQQRLFAA